MDDRDSTRDSEAQGRSACFGNKNDGEPVSLTEGRSAPEIVLCEVTSSVLCNKLRLTACFGRTYQAIGAGL